VAQILKSVESVLRKMGPSPRRFLDASTLPSLRRTFQGFKHRFTTAEDLVALLKGVQRVVGRYGSLYNCLLTGYREEHDTVIPALTFMAGELAGTSHDLCNSLLPLPERGSACKRLHLFMRWMVRKDRVDPGGWRKVPPAKLVVPLDTHMHRISSLLGLTRRRQADLRTAVEVTCAFRKIEPRDPVRYDFALTRLGIRNDMGPEEMAETIEALRGVNDGQAAERGRR
jgi:uncharacterized protein (TIGR02757 family)